MKIADIIRASIETKEQVLANDGIHETIALIVEQAICTLKSGGRILLCGNGGSAADAQHIAAELSGRFAFDRAPLDAEALHVNTSYLTAVANDYSFEDTYSRLITAKGRSGDILIAISTSGNSENIINAINTANKLGMITVGLTGRNGGKLKDICKHLINIPSDDTPRIQESHILIGHIFCQLVEEGMYKK